MSQRATHNCRAAEPRNRLAPSEPSPEVLQLKPPSRRLPLVSPGVQSQAWDGPPSPAAAVSSTDFCCEERQKLAEG
ncbi:hypothetical protein RRG08_046055 [Elysia crispata]|uniref:Uncharacterized protein n=1 Tax=Elysia crispata TaxID=231223 RepID=A0AAE1AA71_9GAST|nr:hypothetical protein RRG08_046055 [Elysia crispata]